MAVIVSRRLARYGTFIIVAALVILTTRTSHANYHLLSRSSSWLSPATHSEKMVAEPTTSRLITEDKEAISKTGPNPTTSFLPQTDGGMRVHANGMNGHLHHESLHHDNHKSISMHETDPPVTTSVTDASITMTMNLESSTPTTKSGSPAQTEIEQEKKVDRGTVDQKEQVQIRLNNPPDSKPVGQNTSSVSVPKYVESILNLKVATLDRLACPGEMEARPRYRVLRRELGTKAKIRYLFALDLYQSIGVLPRLLGTIVQAAKFLGPENCGLSIVEGRSTDGTFEVLEALRTHLNKLGLRYWLQQSDLNPKDGAIDRIEALARLRNMAFEPMLNETELFSEKPLIVFINDIVPCPDDVYEMIYQHELQNAVQTCAMDWIEKGENFYDVWVSRSMTGEMFWEIPQDGSWVFVKNLFFDDPFTKDKYTRGEPFQVFSCWGGMTVIDGSPFIHNSLRIRRSYKGECYGGEPQLLGSDLAKFGISRVQTLPEVNVGYTNEEGLQVKKLRNYVHERVDVNKLIERFEEDNITERIKWKSPPSKILCVPDFRNRWWVDAWYDPSKEE